MELTDISSLIFYFFFTTYIVIGLYAFFLPFKYPLKVLYTILCFVLSLSSFAFAIMNSNPSAYTAFVWRRVSIIPFAFTYPLVLYYVLKISGYVYMLKKRIWVLLFVPAVFLSFIYGIYTPTASAIFSVRSTPYGCVAVIRNPYLQLVLTLYYLVYLLAVLFCLMGVCSRNSGTQLKSKCRLLFISFVLTLFINLMFDLFMHYFCNINIQSIGVFALLFPVLVMLRISLKYTRADFYTSMENKAYPGKYFPHKYIFRTVAYLYIQLGLLNIGMAYILVQIDIIEGMCVGIYAVVTGAMILLLQNSKLNKKKADTFCVIFIVLSIPVILFTYYETAAMTIWAFPMSLLLISILFSDMFFLRLVAAVTLICYVIMLSFTPNVTAVIGMEEHVFRILLFIAGTYIAAYIQKMYKMRFAEIQKRIQIQRIIFEISHILLRSSLSNIEEHIAFALRIIGNFFDVDKTFVYRFVPGERYPVRIGSWMHPDLLSMPQHEKKSVDFPSFCLSQLRAKKKINFSDIESQVFLSKRE